jgi:hypothetical protein
MLANFGIPDIIFLPFLHIFIVKIGVKFQFFCIFLLVNNDFLTFSGKGGKISTTNEKESKILVGSSDPGKQCSINRAGKNLSQSRLAILNRAKNELRKLFGRS